MIRLHRFEAFDGVVWVGGFRRRGVEAELRDADVEGVVAPGHALAPEAHIGPAAVAVQVEDAVAVGLERDDVVLEAHAAVHDGDEPFPVGGPVERVEVPDLLVRVFARLAAGQLIDEEAARGVIHAAVLLVLPLEERDPFAIGAPAGVARVVGDPSAAPAVGVHHVQVSRAPFARALVRLEADERAVGRRLRVEFVHIRRFREVHWMQAVGLHPVDLPVSVAFRLEQDPVRIAVQFGQQVRGRARRLLVPDAHGQGAGR